MSKKHYIIPIFVPHEGCPHNCVFCNQNSITGTRDLVDAAFVRNTIEQYLETIDASDATVEVSFFGGTFTAIPMAKQNELLSVAKEYKDAGKIQHIRMSTRPDYIDREILDNLTRFDADIIELGVQSMDDEVLKLAGRGHTEEDVARASEMIKNYGITLGIQVMVGLPGDTAAKDVETAWKVARLKPEIVRIYPSLVIKNTPMENMYREGKYSPYDLDAAVSVSKTLYGIFETSGINVIRMGLQPTEEINVGKEIVAGPFHPAFRELVEGSLFNEMIGEALKGIDAGKVKIGINPKDISKLYANKKSFFIDMMKQFSTRTIEVSQEASVERGKVLLILDETCRKLSIDDFLMKKYKKGNFPAV